MGVRYLIAGAGGLSAAFLIFLAMQTLVATGKAAIDEVKGGKVIDFVRLRREEASETRKRELPKRKAKAEDPKAPELNLAAKASAGKGSIVHEAIQFTAPASDQSMRISGGPHLGAAMSDADVIPLVRVNPQYPQNAAQQRIEGWVQLEFDISVNGSVRNPKIMAAQPPGIFNQAALAAIRKWKYKPKIENGVAVERRNIPVQLTFKLEDIGQ